MEALSSGCRIRGSRFAFLPVSAAAAVLRSAARRVSLAALRVSAAPLLPGAVRF